MAMGSFALLLGLGAVYAALRTRRRRAEIAATYASTGGVVYTGVQIGCAGLLILAGLGLIGLGLASRP